MARARTTVSLPSPYYPPRARWYGGIFRLAAAVRHGMALDRIRLPRDVTWRGLAAGFLVPGLAVWLRGPRIWGRAAMATAVLLFSIFIVWLGYPAANLAFGLMISLHATGFVYYCSPVLNEWPFHRRIFFTVAALLGIGLLVYSPLRGAVQNHYLMPVRIKGHVIVVQKFTSVAQIHRGDWVAYFLSGHLFTNHGYEETRDRNGMGLGPVLALPGDHVIFSGQTFSVNGIRHPALPYMPAGGNLVVPEKHWFIWPSYTISGRGDSIRITELMMDAATVDQDQYAGKPVAHWFWRKQIMQ
ncbi:MAG TPA: hypothetical protein VFY06_15890 [Verrucomicrobiae bacterium]|nr:hypothetical protein [Verrucomicrobiae bacterium]